MEAKVLEHGAPVWLLEILDNHAHAINANKPVAGMGTSVTESECGIAVNVAVTAGAGGEGGEGGGVSQEITGAVNGVPAIIWLFADPTQNEGEWEEL